MIGTFYMIYSHTPVPESSNIPSILHSIYQSHDILTVRLFSSHLVAPIRPPRRSAPCRTGVRRPSSGSVGRLPIFCGWCNNSTPRRVQCHRGTTAVPCDSAIGGRTVRIPSTRAAREEVRTPDPDFSARVCRMQGEEARGEVGSVG